MDQEADNKIQELKDDLVNKITEASSEKKIQTSAYLSHQGEILDNILKDDVYLISAGGKAPMVFMSMNQAGILSEGTDLNIPDIERISAGELKKEKSGEEHSSSEVFKRVVNDKDAFVLQRRSVDTALIIGLDRAKSLLGLEDAPILHAQQSEVSKNQNHFNQLVQTYVDDPTKKAVVSLSDDGTLRLEISDSALEQLQKTMDEYGLTADQLIEHIQGHFDRDVPEPG